MADPSSSAYSSRLRDHYENPRNIGELEEPDAVALVHNPVCGDMLRLAVQVRNGRIVEVRFKAYGCAAAIAAASVATELMKGAPVEEAKAISEEQITRELGGLPPMKIHASVLAREGIRGALERLTKSKAEAN